MRNQFTEQLLQNAVVATATCAPMEVSGYTMPTFQLSGAFTATVTFEATVNNSDWAEMRVVDVSSGGAATTATAAGIFVSVYDVPFHAVRARVTTYTDGPVTVWARAIAQR